MKTKTFIIVALCVLMLKTTSAEAKGFDNDSIFKDRSETSFLEEFENAEGNFFEKVEKMGSKLMTSAQKELQAMKKNVLKKIEKLKRSFKKK